MSSKLPWTRLFADKWVINLACLPSIEGNVYMRLRLQMLHTGEPLVNNLKVLAHYTGYSVKTFVKALDVLLSMGHIIRLEDGRLWNLDVEEEFNNSNGNLDKVSKTSRSKRLSERAQKAAIARWNKHKNDACDHAKAPENTENYAKNDAKVVKHDAYDMLDDAYIYNINNNTNINSYNKKTNTIVLAKKEIDFEDLETNEQVDEPSEDHDCEKRADAIETVAEDKPPIHEQENIPKKAKRRVKTNKSGRLPEDFEPNLQYAIDKGLTHDEALLEVERFRNFWLAIPSKNADQRDWQRTWYNWVTNQNGTLAKKKEKLEREKRYGKPIIENTE
ncbi:hypothetical protein [Bartonella machadoae]|uniref:hypothetical protein n=1 Tax=Bartonella machadoae TaxID=2893471 RepID=UPI0027E25A94|nr:hypothetical protein [Bartonella machadoae]